MSENSNLSNSNSGYTPQGQLVAAHWTRLAPTYKGALEWLHAKGIDPIKAKVEDLLADMAGIGQGKKVLDVGCGVGGPAMTGGSLSCSSRELVIRAATLNQLFRWSYRSRPN